MLPHRKYNLPDAALLVRRLVRCRSITPEDDGALALTAEQLGELGFVCNRLNFDGVGNLFAFLSGGIGPHFSFCGHVDVVPANPKDWSHPPFAGEQANGRIYGRGVVDMKGAVACFIAAAGEFVRSRSGIFNGGISLMLTADEEGKAENGIRRLVSWLKEKNKLPDFCLVGEPTSARRLGDQMRIGRRGSLRLTFKVAGESGHSAWPERADNPIPRLTALLGELATMPLGQGSDNFPPDTLAITKISADGGAPNVTPQDAEAAVNIRFAEGSCQQLAKKVERYLNRKHRFKMTAETNAEPFICNNKRLITLISQAAEERTGNKPQPGCSGGTSDARFIAPHCPVAEFGLVGSTMHKADENCSLTDLADLTAIYRLILEKFFG